MRPTLNSLPFPGRPISGAGPGPPPLALLAPLLLRLLASPGGIPEWQLIVICNNVGASGKFYF